MTQPGHVLQQYQPPGVAPPNLPGPLTARVQFAMDEDGGVYQNTPGGVVTLVPPQRLGEHWTLRPDPVAAVATWNAVTYGAGRFVAVATNRVMTSPDGVSWTGQTPVPVGQWMSICYGANQFVAVAQGGTNLVMTSPDGVTWTGQTAASPLQWSSVCYGANRFAAVAISGTGNRVMTSLDGVSWTPQVSAADNSWAEVCYGAGRFVAVAQSGADRVMTSP